MKLVTLTQLLNQWWRFPETIERDEIDALDWDELLLTLEISCPQAEGRNVVITDFDMTTYLNPAVSFTLIE